MSEIEGLVEASAEHGKMEEGEAEYIQNVFRFGDLEVSDVMVHRTEMVTVNADDPPEEIVNAVLKAEYTRMPLWRDKPENIVGILHAKDLLRALARAEGDLAQARHRWRSRCRPGSCRTSGRCRSSSRRSAGARPTSRWWSTNTARSKGWSRSRTFSRRSSATSPTSTTSPVPGVRPQPDGSVNVDGSVPIRDLNRAMDWNLPDEDATTIAGLVIHEARSIPDAGQSFTFHGFRFSVLRKQRNRITALRITPLVRKPVLMARAG